MTTITQATIPVTGTDGVTDTVSSVTPGESEKKSSTREYIIFEKKGQKSWDEVKRVTATDIESAINSLGSELKQGTKYVAVAERYWKPGSPKVETHTTISLTFD